MPLKAMTRPMATPTPSKDLERLMPEKVRRAPRIFARVEEKNGQKRGALHLLDAVGGWGGIRAKDVVEKLEALKDEGAEVLDVHLNSPGGDVWEGIGINSAIAAWDRGTKRVHIDGLAASIASIISMAGDEIEISPAGMVMVHAPFSFAIGDAVELRKMADRLDTIKDVMCDIYAMRTGLAKPEVEKLVAEETWMSASEAVEKGFADKIARSGPNEDEPGDVPDSEGEDESEQDPVVRAMALFKKAPPEVAKLLNLRYAASAARPLTPKESLMSAESIPAPAAQAVALNARAVEAQVAALTVRAETAEKGQAELLSAIGKATAGEALAMIAGLKEKAAKADELAGRVAHLEAVRRTQQVTALLDAAARDGRLTPAKRAELMKDDAPAFARDPAQLQVFLDCLQPVVVPAAAPKHQEPVKEPEPVLTEDEKHFAEQLKLDPKAIAEFKAKAKTK
jgi:ATP-dependent Clp protease protease subunit